MHIGIASPSNVFLFHCSAPTSYPFVLTLCFFNCIDFLSYLEETLQATIETGSGLKGNVNFIHVLTSLSVL